MLRSFEDSGAINFNPHRLADRNVTDISMLKILHNKAEFLDLLLVCNPPPLFRGRAWMPEIERPKFRKDAKQAERSLKGKFSALRGIERGWRGLRKWQCRVQRERQAHTDPRPTKSECDSSNAKPYKHTYTCF